MYWGDYQGTHYSPLKQIDTTQRGAAAGDVGDADAGRLVIEARRSSWTA